MDNNSYEHDVALRESSRIHSNDEYFKARPQIDNHDRRNVFDAGYDRGWQAAQQQSAGEIAELKADNERLREAFKELAFIVQNRQSPSCQKGVIDKCRCTTCVIERGNATTSQSLQAHDNELIERCADVCYASYRDTDDLRDLSLADSIMALKGK
jgi:hypothetical protein